MIPLRRRQKERNRILEKFERELADVDAVLAQARAQCRLENLSNGSQK